MLFAVHCLDKPGHAHVRAANRDAHLANLKALGDTLKAAGPLLSDDGTQMVGSLLLIDADSRDAVQAICAADPYAQAGLFETTIIRPYKLVLGTLAG